MLSRTEFAEQLTDAYNHLYDLVHLRTHPLTDLLVIDPGLRRKEKAWRLHHLLLDAIAELDPGPKAPVFSREWRHYRLMVLHHVDGLDPQSVADELAISRRHYYREHEAAIQAISSILWNRHTDRSATLHQGPANVEGQEASSRLELLRLEAARLAQSRRYARLGDVIQGVLSLLQDMLQKHDLSISLALSDALLDTSVDRNMLRQMLLGILGYLIECTERATVRLVAETDASMVTLSLTAEPPTAIHPMSEEEVRERLLAFEEMAVLSGVQVLPIGAQDSIVGFEMHLPAGSQRTVLVVDDNEDIVELFRRYLSSNDYRVVTAQTAQDALILARRLQPHAITLDLMMPDRDGWELMQILLNQPETAHIPIIVCSVLKQKELALSLGATAFLAKPVTELALLATLKAVEKK